MDGVLVFSSEKEKIKGKIHERVKHRAQSTQGTPEFVYLTEYSM
jgi:hypothetical protein